MNEWLANKIKRLVNSHINFSLLKRFTVIFGVEVMVKASSIVLLPIYLRLMSQAEFGVYNYFFSIIQVFTLILSLGLYTSLNKYYHKYHSRVERGSLLFTISVSLLVFIFIFCSLSFFFKIDYWIIGKLFKETSSYSQYREIALFSLIISVVSFMLTNFFYATEKIREVKRYNLSRIIFINVSTIIGLYLFRSDPVGIRLLLTGCAELVLILVFGYYFVKETVFNFSKSFMWTSLKMGVPVMISAIFGIVINFSDKYFLEKYGNLKDLSAYFLAVSFANILPFVFSSFQNIWLPIFLKETDAQKNFEKNQRLISRLFVGLVIIGLGVWILLFALLQLNIIQSQYSQALLILPLLILAQIVSPLTTLYSNYLISIEKTYVASIAGLIVSVISVSLGAWLVPNYGVYGSALSIFGSYLSYLILYYYWVRFEKRKMDFGIQWQQ